MNWLLVVSNKNEIVASFDWHPMKENKLLMVTKNTKMYLVPVLERIAVVCVAFIKLVIAINYSVFKLVVSH